MGKCKCTFTFTRSNWPNLSASLPRPSFPARVLTKPWSGDIFQVMGDQTHILGAITVLVGREIFATGIQLHIPGVQIGSGAAATAEAVAGIFGGRH